MDERTIDKQSTKHTNGCMVGGGRETCRKENCWFEKKIKNPKVVLNNLETRDYLKQLQTQNVIVPINKANNNIAFVCKTFHIQTLFEELGLQNRFPKTDKISIANKIDLLQHHVNHSKAKDC